MPRVDLFPAQQSPSRAYNTLAGDIVSRPTGSVGLNYSVLTRIGNRQVFAVAESKEEVDRYTAAAGQEQTVARRHPSRRAAWEELRRHAQQRATRAYLWRCQLNCIEPTPPTPATTRDTICDRCCIA